MGRARGGARFLAPVPHGARDAHGIGCGHSQESGTEDGQTATVFAPPGPMGIDTFLQEFA